MCRAHPWDRISNKMLKGKHIILGITGSIAAYKAAYIIRALVKKGAEAVSYTHLDVYKRQPKKSKRNDREKNTGHF